MPNRITFLQEMYDHRYPEERWTLLDQAKYRYWGAREEGLRECISLLQEALDYNGRWSEKGMEALEALEWANGELENLLNLTR